MKRFVCVSLCGLLLLAWAASAHAEPPAPLSVRIVPTNSYGDKRSITLYLPNAHFHVVVTNISDKPVTLWKEWCSWGYFNLSFEVTGEDGKTAVVTKADRGWDKNYPDPVTLSPMDSLVYEVSFDPSVWKNAAVFTESKHGSGLTLKMKALFRNEKAKDAFGKDIAVWDGMVSSPAETYTFYK